MHDYGRPTIKIMKRAIQEESENKYQDVKRFLWQKYQYHIYKHEDQGKCI